MTRNIILLLISLSIQSVTYAQQGTWTWIGGDSLPLSAGNYGVQGVPSPSNLPPGVYEACEWTDHSGNFWLFGGVTYCVTANFFSDLWKYNPYTSLWTWVKGPGTINYAGNFGTQGIEDPANNPPGISFGAITWVDTAGNLWLFGGLKKPFLDESNDLWKFNISTNNWTWMRGGNQGSYGTLGVPSLTNDPPPRDESSASWVDQNGNLWHFGGMESPGFGPLPDQYNDLWKYDPVTNEWTWMKGSNLLGQPGVYGTIGVSDSLNVPCARSVYTTWADSLNNLWMFGGVQWFDNNSRTVTYNDLWKFDISNNNWTWMSGTQDTNAAGNYGIKGVASVNNISGGRLENRARWTDCENNFWFFGGAFDNGKHEYNDLWKYNIASNAWTWVSGDSAANQPGSFGVLNVPAASNLPEARMGANSWQDTLGNFYLFGGSVASGIIFNCRYPSNNLWKYIPANSCTPVSVNESDRITTGIEITPNPVKKEIKIFLPGTYNRKIVLEIINTSGEIVLRKYNLSLKSNSFDLNIADLPSGIYFVKIITGKKSFTGRFIKN